MFKVPTELLQNYANGDLSSLFYKLAVKRTDGSNTSSSGAFLVDTSTGATRATLTAVGTFSAQLIAVDGAGDEALVFNFTYDVKIRDEDVPTNGPNGRTCENNGVPHDTTL